MIPKSNSTDRDCLECKNLRGGRLLGAVDPAVPYLLTKHYLVTEYKNYLLPNAMHIFKSNASDKQSAKR